MHRARSLLEIKAVDGERRIITGIATTPTADRMGDVVEPEGAVFNLPIPLLWQHDTHQPIGEVFDARVTKKGIEVSARIAQIDEPGALQDRVNEAWLSIKNKLVKGLSIGFRSLKEAFDKETFGFIFLEWEWLELSAVTIPANAQASIQTVKHYDIERPAASGTVAAVPSTTTSGVSDGIRAVKAVHLRHPMKKSYAQAIKDYEATRAAKQAELDAIIDASIEKGETFDAAQREQHDDLALEIKNIDDQLVVLRSAEKRLADAAIEVKGQTLRDGTESRRPVHVEVKSRMPDGLEFAAAVLCRANAFVEMQRGNFVSAIQIAKSRYPDYQGIHQYLQAPERKTAVAGGTTSDSNWATSLLEPNQVLVNEFLEYLRPRTLIGRIPGLRRVPFNVTIQSQTTGASASWVGQGKAKPLTKFNTATTTLAFTKVAAIAVITNELARFSRPGAEALVRDELTRAAVERLDLDFVDPAKAVSAGVNPASITNGVTPGSTAGTSAANALTDIQNLVAPFINAKYPTGELVILMPDSLAFALSLMLNASGFRSFPDISINGGAIGSLPVITSQYLANTSSYGNMVVVLHAPSIALADDGNVAIDVSAEASLEMSDAPAQDSTAGTGASMVSMFQTNSLAIRAEREINWKKLRSDAVTFYDDVNWGSIGSPV